MKSDKYLVSISMTITEAIKKISVTKVHLVSNERSGPRMVEELKNIRAEMMTRDANLIRRSEVLQMSTVKRGP